MRKQFNVSRLPLTLSLIAGLSACGGSSQQAFVELSFNNLENLGSSAVYEGWLMVDGAPVTTGRFSVDASGKLSQSSFQITQAVYEKASAFILTIEPAQNDVPAPSTQHLLAGNVDTQKSASLSTSHSAALGTDFSSSVGSFILATPSSASTDDNDQGIWFLKMVNGAPQASLTLPTLPTGWVYEGWVVVNGTATSTGRFRDPTKADLDGAGPTSGPLAGPPFPGQDFINPPIRLPGGMAVVSVEPEPDNSPAPFTIKPLINTAISTATGGANSQNLALRASNLLPNGTAKLVLR